MVDKIALLGVTPDDRNRVVQVVSTMGEQLLLTAHSVNKKHALKLTCIRGIYSIVASIIMFGGVYPVGPK